MHQPIVHVYAPCFNEENIIPYFVRHYQSFVERIFVYDNQSTDRSVEILKSYNNLVLRTFESGNEQRTDLITEIKETAWYESRGRADFIIACDMDELLYHPEMMQLLIKLKKHRFTVAKPLGFNMISKSFPTTDENIYNEVKEGARVRLWDKMVLFNPNEIERMNYAPGSHLALPEGNVKLYQNDQLLRLLHFRYLGLEYVLGKNKLRNGRLSDENIKNNWGYHYTLNDQNQIEIFNKIWARKVRALQ
ncbi:MAG TPA: glycosyltransferase family 2 protein [Cyclobacteriaceae bacterium]